MGVIKYNRLTCWGTSVGGWGVPQTVLAVLHTGTHMTIIPGPGGRRALEFNWRGLGRDLAGKGKLTQTRLHGVRAKSLCCCCICTWVSGRNRCVMCLYFPIPQGHRDSLSGRALGRKCCRGRFPFHLAPTTGQGLVQVPLPTGVQSVHSAEDVLQVDRWGWRSSFQRPWLPYPQICLQEDLITPHKCRVCSLSKVSWAYVDRFMISPSRNQGKLLLFGLQASKRKPVGGRQHMSLQHSAQSFTWAWRAESQDGPRTFHFWFYCHDYLTFHGRHDLVDVIKVDNCT